MHLILLNFFRCPSRACPNPDVVKPAWEKTDKDKNSGGEGPAARKRSNLKRKRSRPRSKVKEADKATVEPITAVSESTVMMNRTSSLLRDALLGGPRAAAVVDSGGQRRQLVQRPRTEQPPSLQQSPSPEGGQRQVIVMLTPTYSTLPTSIALPQTPVPLSQLTASTNNNSVHDHQISNTNGDCTLRSVSSMTPPSCSGSSSSSLGTTTSRDDDIMDDLMNIDDSMLFEMMDPKRMSEVTDTKELLSCRPSLTGSPLTLPLLDQSDDPCLNEGDPLSFVTDELDETVQKWMETCEGNFVLPI